MACGSFRRGLPALGSVRFLSDVHITIKLSKRLEELGHQSEHINNILDKWHTHDRDIITYIDAHQGILVTKDQGFRNSSLLKCLPYKKVKTRAIFRKGYIEAGEDIFIFKDEKAHTRTSCRL